MKLKAVLSIAIFLMFFISNSNASSSVAGGLIVDWFAGDGANLTNVPNTTVAANKITWDKAMQWDGGSTNLVAATARTNLELGTLATQNSNGVSISGGTVTGITDLAIADGGTGASTAAQARANLGVADNSSVAITGGTITGITNFNATGGTIGGTTNFNLEQPAWYSYDGYGVAQSNMYINSTVTADLQSDIIRLKGTKVYNTTKYLTALSYDMFDVSSGGAQNGVQGVAGSVATYSLSSAKSQHGTALDLGSSGSTAIVGMLGQIFPGYNTQNYGAIALNSICSGDYSYSGGVLNPNQALGRCRGLNFVSHGSNESTKGQYDYVILSQANYSQAGITIDNMQSNGTVEHPDYIRLRTKEGYHVLSVSDKGYISIGDNNNYTNGITPAWNRINTTPFGAIDIHASVTDLPVANDWVARSSGSKQKIVSAKVTKNDKSYSNKSKNWNSSKWVRLAIVTDGEVLSTLGKKHEIVSQSNAFDEISDAIWTDVSKYNYTYAYDSTINKTVLVSKTPITNYSVKYSYNNDGTPVEIRTPKFQLIPTGKKVKTLKSGIIFNETDGKFYKEVPHSSVVIEAKRTELLAEKQKKAQFSKERVGGLIDDSNVPVEILEYNEDGSIKGYGLELMSLYLFEVTREQREMIDDLQAQIDDLKKGKP